MYVSAPQSVASEYISNFKKVPAIQNMPPQVATWKRTPTVIVCEHAPVTEKQAQAAVKFWKGLHHRFFTTQYHHDPLNKCRQEQPVGYIIIHLVTQSINLEDKDLAETHFFINTDHDEIEWAIIYLRSDVKELVLEHEIGHALGYLHYNKINHVMNSKWVQGGWDTDGLDKTQR
jgi:hypothetical protein